MGTPAGASSCVVTCRRVTAAPRLPPSDPSPPRPLGRAKLLAAPRGGQSRLFWSRSRAEGDTCSGVNKVRDPLGTLAARGPKASPKTPRRVGPPRAEDFGLGADVDVTSAFYVFTRTYAGVADRSAQQPTGETGPSRPRATVPGPGGRGRPRLSRMPCGPALPARSAASR